MRIKKVMNNKEVSIRCDCIGKCTNLTVEKVQYENCPDSYYFKFENSYLGNEKVSKWKQIWNILTHKNTCYAEVYIENADKLISFMNSIMELIDN